MNNLPFGFIFLVISLGIAILSVKKENVIVPLVIAMCFLPGDLSIQIFTLDFQAVRIMALVALLRIFIDFNDTKIKLNTIDTLFISYNILGAIVYFLASYNKFGAILYKGGVLIDSIVLYLVLRHIIQSKEAIMLVVKTLSLCAIGLLPFVIFEFFTAQNLFSFLGRSAISFRHGEVRAAATFSHSILFGSFAAALLPVIWADLKIKKSFANSLAILCCLFFVYACSSSGPIVALAAVIFFLCFFKWKNYSSMFAWLMLTGAIIIHLIREKPLWHLLYVRISVRSGSTGYHRYLLMEAAVKEFWEWWLLGYGDIGAQWHLKYWPHTHASFTDVTNHYLLEAVRGGFFTMVLFIILCYLSIKTLCSHSIAQKDVKDQWLWWGFAVMLMAHCITFLSVGYFGQIQMFFFLTVAIAAFALDESQKPEQKNLDKKFTSTRHINRGRQSSE